MRRTVPPVTESPHSGTADQTLLRWENGSAVATLDADLADGSFSITHAIDGQQPVLTYG